MSHCPPLPFPQFFKLRVLEESRKTTNRLPMTALGSACNKLYRSSQFRLPSQRPLVGSRQW
ncbi:hypothetical protein FA13DRAFT_1746050 [Coprinellus micaceus]|uniref:Uncharacterized protein n=1 Tax=Coprinellus micaceus TaxID=71717 RepID=A0A4Y7S9Z4_COPMI|nr:hypothetical protein FA13DRAFT_1746050 [Coprinellus micaceus]